MDQRFRWLLLVMQSGPQFQHPGGHSVFQVVLSVPRGSCAILEVVWSCAHWGHLLGPSSAEVAVLGLEVDASGLLRWRSLALACLAEVKALPCSCECSWLGSALFAVTPLYLILWSLLPQGCSHGCL